MTMKTYNCIVVFNYDKTKALFCRRIKDPFKGKLNFVGGKVEPGESEEDAAYRELMEETGYESSQWTHLLTIPSNATVSDNYAFVFLARNCRKCGEQNLDETECLNVMKLTAEEIEELIRSGRFQQSVHVMAWLLAKEHARKG